MSKYIIKNRVQSIDDLHNFNDQGLVNTKASKESGLPKGIPIRYRAGDQPNNAMSLNVLIPG